MTEEMYGDGWLALLLEYLCACERVCVCVCACLHVCLHVCLLCSPDRRAVAADHHLRVAAVVRARARVVDPKAIEVELVLCVGGTRVRWVLGRCGATTLHLQNVCRKLGWHEGSSAALCVHGSEPSQGHENGKEGLHW